MISPGVDPPLPFFPVTARLGVSKAGVSMRVPLNSQALVWALALSERPPGACRSPSESVLHGGEPTGTTRRLQASPLRCALTRDYLDESRTVPLALDHSSWKKAPCGLADGREQWQILAHSVIYACDLPLLGLWLRRPGGPAAAWARSRGMFVGHFTCCGVMTWRTWTHGPPRRALTQCSRPPEEGDGQGPYSHFGWPDMLGPEALESPGTIQNSLLCAETADKRAGVLVSAPRSHQSSPRDRASSPGQG